jgi:hypothetical protein
LIIQWEAVKGDHQEGGIHAARGASLQRVIRLAIKRKVIDIL